MEETRRIRKAYLKRIREGKHLPVAFFSEGDLFIYQKREQALIKFFKKNCPNLSKITILEVGSGTGFVLREFVKYGVAPEKVYGLELLDFQLDESRKISPNICCIRANGGDIPFLSNSFDIICQFTVFTSILEATLKKKVANEMVRVVKPEGFILWYDFFHDNPWNPDVKGVKAKEIRELFHDCDIHLKRITLAPPLARAIAPFSVILCQILEKIPLFCTHYLGIIRRRD